MLKAISQRYLKKKIYFQISMRTNLMNLLFNIKRTTHHLMTSFKIRYNILHEFWFLSSIWLYDNYSYLFISSIFLLFYFSIRNTA